MEGLKQDGNKQFINAEDAQRLSASLQSRNVNYKVRMESARALGDWSQSKLLGAQENLMISALIHVLLDRDDNCVVRHKAAKGLGNWSQNQLLIAQKGMIISALIHVLLDRGDNYEVRHVAARALGDWSQNQLLGILKGLIFSSLIHVLLDQDDDYAVRQQAAIILENCSKSQLSNARITQIIESLLNFKSDDEKLALPTTQILGRQFEKTLPKGLQEQIINRFNYLAKDHKSQKVRELAQQCLYSVEQSQAVTKKPCRLPTVTTGIASSVRAGDLQSSMAMLNFQEDWVALEGGATKDYSIV